MRTLTFVTCLMASVKTHWENMSADAMTVSCYHRMIRKPAYVSGDKFHIKNFTYNTEHLTVMDYTVMAIPKKHIYYYYYSVIELVSISVLS